VQPADDLRFISIPPVLVPAKSTFLYKMVVASITGDKVAIDVLNKPDWMQWDQETQQLSGTVPETGGVFSVTMVASTVSGAKAEQSFTVTIDQPEVKGAATVGMWKDPFHPNLNEINTATESYLPLVDGEESAVLGEATQNTQPEAGESELIQKVSQYEGVVVVGLLIVVTGMFVVFAKRNSRAKRLANQGIVIERGSR
jgi:Kef-type K+ transport system membrane component KefB